MLDSSSAIYLSFAPEFCTWNLQRFITVSVYTRNSGLEWSTSSSAAHWNTYVNLCCNALRFCCVSGSYYSYNRYYELKSKNITGEFGLSQAFVLNFQYYLSLKQTWLAFGQLQYISVDSLAVALYLAFRQTKLTVSLSQYISVNSLSL